MIDVPETTARAERQDRAGESRVVRIELVESDTDSGADPFDAEALRASLKHNGGAKTLSEAINEAAGGADRLQLQVIRERLLGIEARTTETQLLQRRQGRELYRIRLALYVVAGLLAALLLFSVVGLLV